MPLPARRRGRRAAPGALPAPALPASHRPARQRSLNSRGSRAGRGEGMSHRLVRSAKRSPCPAAGAARQGPRTGQEDGAGPAASTAAARQRERQRWLESSSSTRGRPAARWVLLAFLLLALVVLLGVQGLSTRTTGRSATPVRGTPGPLASAGPVLIWDGQRLVSNRRSAGHQIALSFDDGPDPRWTPRIAATLRRLGVPATFFVVGSEVVAPPGRRPLAAPSRLRARQPHLHARDLAADPDWERTLQIALTESAVAGAVAVRPRLLRPPYSSVPAAVNDSPGAGATASAQRGYVIALSDFDGEDWRRAGGRLDRAGRSRRAATGAASCCSTTAVATARRRWPRSSRVPALQARGFRFVTVSELAGLPRDQAELRGGRLAHRRGRLLLGDLASRAGRPTRSACSSSSVTALFGARVCHSRCVRPAPCAQRSSRSLPPSRWRRRCRWSCRRSTRPSGSSAPWRRWQRASTRTSR